MKQIRDSVFETNSSSSHSVSVSQNISKGFETIVPDEDGIIIFYGEGFGSSLNKYNDAITKANYLFASTYDLVTRDRLIKVIMEHTGAKFVIYDNKAGYVDHKSVGTANDILASEEQIKLFIFNPRSSLITSSDGDCVSPNWFDDEDTIYKYEVTVERCKESVKFVARPSIDELREAITFICRGLGYYHSEYNGRGKGKNHSFYSYPMRLVDGKEVDSFSRLSENKLELFDLSAVYSKGKNTNFLGYQLNGKTSISIDLKEI